MNKTTRDRRKVLRVYASHGVADAFFKVLDFLGIPDKTIKQDTGFIYYPKRQKNTRVVKRMTAASKNRRFSYWMGGKLFGLN